MQAIAPVILADFLGFEWQQILADPAQHPASFLSLDRSNVCRAVLSDQYVGLNCGRRSLKSSTAVVGVAPTPFALPDSLHSAPARARTEALMGRSALMNESLVAA